MSPVRRTALPLAIAIALSLSLAACQKAPAPNAGVEATPVTQAAIARPSRQYAIEDFVESTGVGGSSFSADETRLLFSSNKSGIWNTYSMPVAGGDWTPITQSTTDNNYSVAYFPADDRVLITRDQGGNELNHLYVIQADGTEKDLTPGENLKADFLGFTDDGSAFHVISNERDPRFFDVYRYDSADYSRTRVYENTEGLEPGVLSGDGKWLALGQTNTTNDSDLHVVELATGKSTRISQHEGQAAFNAQDFSPDGQWLYYTANDQCD